MYMVYELILVWRFILKNNIQNVHNISFGYKNISIFKAKKVKK